ncbi:MAG: hypothetical protein HND56_07420 [Pseudomonadota bacterium]|nr:hypothetical protein [Pseudomonadota bacterium]QKK05522.1 MAG: hypothetical protein HND56_07420 [Pseudomonadota bacterium]
MTTENEKPTPSIVFHADKPIQSVQEDRLGFSPIADNLATSILKMNADGGFVIGIEGPWGCGKSSILNLLCAKIKDEQNISIIKFSPWIIGDKDSMVSSLAEELSEAIKKTGQQNENLAKKMKKYGKAGIKKIAPWAALIPTYGENAKELSDLLSGSLTDLKDELTRALQAIKQTFVVIIDDLDRLEPEEALEITRLIRAVGDFPNVIYILCYDKEILSKSLETALHIKDGNAFLQKIVQASFSVPKPEEFDLRNWMNKECQLLYEEVTGKSLPDNLSSRLQEVCYTHGGKIETPREINLILNSLKLAYPPISEKVDFPDLCWLHLEKIKNDAFYRWIENYLNAFSVVVRGEGHLNGAGQAKMTQELLKHLQITDDIEKQSAMHTIINLSEHIPGIDYVWGDDKTLVMTKPTDEELSALERGHRLGSPSHYRLYFSFAQPAGTLDESELSAIINKANNKTLHADDFNKFIYAKRSQGGTMYSVLLDRLNRTPVEVFTSDGCVTLLQVIAESIDDARREEKDDEAHFKIGIGEIGNKLFQKLLPLIDQKTTFLQDFFTSGASVGWLVSSVIGNEIFAHGKSGLAKKGQPSLTTEELEGAIQIINERLTSTDRDKIESVPDALSFFYRWQQSGDDGAKNLKEWMDEISVTDAGFLELLEKCRGYVVSTNGNYRPLNERELTQLFGNSKEILDRVRNIACNLQNEPDLIKQAEELIEAHKMARDF